MSNQQKSTGAPAGLMYFIGALLMFGGTYLSLNVKIAAIESIQEKGLPLDPGKTVASIGVLLILFQFIKPFFITPLIEDMDSRNKHLEDTFAEAENLRTEMTRMRSDYETRLAETEAAAREQIQGQIREAQNLRQQLMSEAAQRADALLRQAEIEIEQEKKNAILVIRTHVVDLTLAAAEKVIGENMDSDKNRRLITEFIDNVEVTA